jgi:hypothetical protein
MRNEEAFICYFQKFKETDQWCNLLNEAMNNCVLQNSENFLTIRAIISFSRRALLLGLTYWKILSLQASHFVCTFTI